MKRLILTMLCALALLGPAGFGTAHAEAGTVQVTTDRDSYPNGKRVTVSIQNGLESPIWVNTTCGVPFILHEENDCEVTVRGAHAGKDCSSPPLEIAPGQTLQQQLNLKKIYTHVFFNLPPGQYRMAIQYFQENPAQTPGLPTPHHATSNPFTLH